MAKGATIYKADLNVADIDRDYYAEHALTLACHPSETEERMMVRLLAFALFAGDGLAFGGGVSTQDEPALWQKDLTGRVRLWIELGHPTERDLRRAAGKAERVAVLCYGGRGSSAWWANARKELERLKNLTVLSIPAPAAQDLGGMAERTMRLQCNIQDEVASIISGDHLVEVEIETLYGDRLADAGLFG